MTQKCAKKLVLLKTFYYRLTNKDGQSLSNYISYNTNPTTASDSSISHMTDKNYNLIKNEFILFNSIIIPPNNPISGITKQIIQETVMIKIKCGFVSANTFYFDSSSSSITTIPIVNYLVTASSGDLKNAVNVTIEFDDNGTIFSNGVKFARRVRVYGYK
jgi:hypothetical protein